MFCTCALLLVRTDELLPERFAALVEVELCDSSLNGWTHTISVQNYSRFNKYCTLNVPTESPFDTKDNIVKFKYSNTVKKNVYVRLN